MADQNDVAFRPKGLAAAGQFKTADVALELLPVALGVLAAVEWNGDSYEGSPAIECPFCNATVHCESGLPCDSSGDLDEDEDEDDSDDDDDDDEEDFDEGPAEAEGWTFHWNVDGSVSLICIGSRFESAGAALAWVQKMATAGSVYHQLALKLVRPGKPELAPAGEPGSKRFQHADNCALKLILEIAREHKIGAANNDEIAGWVSGARPRP